MHHWITQACKEARKGRHSSHLIGALLISGGAVIARAANYSKPHGLENRGRHAEERILRYAVSGCVLVVARCNRKGAPATMSRPCAHCWHLAVKAGVRKVVYVDWQGKITQENV